jgi:hypothetical protein
MSTSSSSVVTSLDYVRMYAEVTGWVAEAVDDNERERLSTLAANYLRQAYDEAEGEADDLYRILPGAVRRWIRGTEPNPAGPVLTASGFEAIRRWAAVTPVGVLEGVDYDEMCDLADLFEGWGQDPKRHAVDAARLIGKSDGLRDLAEAVGPSWKCPPDQEDSLHAFLARSMQTGWIKPPTQYDQPWW